LAIQGVASGVVVRADAGEAVAISDATTTRTA
jgi:hypothetical protein